MTRYFWQLRQDWLEEQLRIYGFVGPQHLKRKFDVSTAQASNDFTDLRKRYKGVYYDPSDKVYKLMDF